MKRPLLLFALSLIFNLLLSFLIRAPNYLDDAYYYGGALRLAQGQGFTEPYVWNYLDSPTSLPRPSHLYWMPLTSIIAALPMMIFGQNFLWRAYPSSSSPASYPSSRITYHASQQPLIVMPSPLASSPLFSGFYPIFFATTDSFALYAFIVSLTFIALYRGTQTNQKRWWFFTGIGIGLAHLTRADGILLIVVALVAMLSQRRLFIVHCSLFILGYLVVTSTWFVRNITPHRFTLRCERRGNVVAGRI